MTQLQSIFKQIEKEKVRIEMIKNTLSNGDATWYDFVNSEIKAANEKIANLQIELNKQYNNTL